MFINKPGEPNYEYPSFLKFYPLSRVNKTSLIRNPVSITVMCIECIGSLLSPFALRFGGSPPFSHGLALEIIRLLTVFFYISPAETAHKYGKYVNETGKY